MHTTLRDLRLEQAKQEVIRAALYVVRSHIPHPLPIPTKHESKRKGVDRLVKWGAIAHLHDVVAEMNRVERGYR